MPLESLVDRTPCNQGTFDCHRIEPSKQALIQLLNGKKVQVSNGVSSKVALTTLRSLWFSDRADPAAMLCLLRSFVEQFEGVVDDPSVDLYYA